MLGVAFGSRAALARLLALALLLGLLPGCLDDLDQSAVQPGQELATTPTAIVLASPQPTRRAVAARQPDRRRIYFLRGGDLWQLPVDSAAAPVVTNRPILAFAPSPDAGEVAVVFQGEQDREEFAIVRDDSTVALHLTLTDAAGTPVAAGAGVNAIAWSPEGNAIAFARDDGSIGVVGLDGKVRQLVAPHRGSHPGDLSWSPDAGSLAYLDPALRDQPTDLSTVSVAGGPVRRLIASGGAERAVLAAAWLDPASLIVAQSKPGDIPHGGDLFQVDAASGRQLLLVSTGQFAPVSGVLAMAVSENGQSLAFTVYVPGDSQPRFQGLWLLNLSTHQLTQVPTAPGEAVTDLWWAAGVLLYRAIPEASSSMAGLYTGIEPFALYQFDPARTAPAERYRSGST